MTQSAVCVPDMHFAPSRYTGKERDTNSGLDYFGARYYASDMGRFLGPDPAGMQAADIEFPQSLNRYAYVWNNPLSFTDPTGLDCAYLNNAGNGLESFDQSSSSGECGRTGGYWVNGGLTNININADQGSVQLTGTTNGDDQTHASYQDTQVYVGYYQTPGGNPFGHIAVAFPGMDAYGQNPKNMADLHRLDMLTASVPGTIKKQVGGQLKSMARVPATGMQAKMIQDQINKSIQNPSNYTIYGKPGCDCATWAQQLLGDAGINAGPSQPIPGPLVNQLNQLYPQQPQ